MVFRYANTNTHTLAYAHMCRCNPAGLFSFPFEAREFEIYAKHGKFLKSTKLKEVGWGALLS